MKALNLYVTDWAPNGTNDLLICDDNHQIVECIEEATFGIDVTKRGVGESILVADDAQVFPVSDETYVQWTKEECIPSEFTFVRQISLEELTQKLAHSPIDPHADQIKASLLKAGIDLRSNEEKLESVQEKLEESLVNDHDCSYSDTAFTCSVETSREHGGFELWLDNLLGSGAASRRTEKLAKQYMDLLIEIHGPGEYQRRVQQQASEMTENTPHWMCSGCNSVVWDAEDLEECPECHAERGTEASTLSVFLEGSSSVRMYVRHSSKETFNVSVRFDQGDAATICGYPQPALIWNDPVDQYDSSSQSGQEYFDDCGQDLSDDEHFEYFVTADDETVIFQAAIDGIRRQAHDPMFKDSASEEYRNKCIEKCKLAITALAKLAA